MSCFQRLNERQNSLHQTKYYRFTNNGVVCEAREPRGRAKVKRTNMEKMLIC